MLGWKAAELRDRLARRYGLRVLSGPFAGMKYIAQSVGSELLPKLLGTYERELHELIEGLLAHPRGRVINVGCGEGYYAVGFALRWPNARIHAFDLDPNARQHCDELARLNTVSDRLSVHAECTLEDLRELISSDSLLVCDCEGDEIELLRPDVVPALEECELIVELHDCFNPLISRTVAGRFAATHSIRHATFAPRTPELFVELIQSIDSREHGPDGNDWLTGWSEAERRLALDENRPVGMQWAHLTPTSVFHRRASAASPSLSIVGPSGAASTPESADNAISACILAYNEEKRIEGAIQCLQSWADQIIVLDNESTDRTAEIARQYTDHVLTVPRVPNFDALRNRAVEVATGGWIFYLDADERVPRRLGELLRQLVRERGHDYDAFGIPFRHHFCGKWIQHSGWWPGYKAPPLLKKGRFRYNERVHGGVEVFGPSCRLPADDLDLTIAHYSYDDLTHYLAKINPYTDAEATSLWADGALHGWHAMLAHFVHDWQLYYEREQGHRDGMHGFVLALMAGVYRFLSRAKLWLLRSQHGELKGPEPVPGSTREMLEFMALVAQEGAEPWLASHVYPVGITAERTVGRVPPEWYLLSPSPGQTAKHADRAGRHGITACIVARNEERRIAGALHSLVGWTDQIIVVDGQSEDRTVEIARRHTDQILTAPDATSFVAARASAAEAVHAAAFDAGDWLFYLDADERVSPHLGQALRRLVRERGGEFDAVSVPFRNLFSGKWMQSDAWWPGYDTPRLLKKGAFQYGDCLQPGIEVKGRLLYFPADDPAYSINHDTSGDIAEYLTRLNRHTNAEAEYRDASGEDHSWQAQLGDFMDGLVVHYDHGRAHQDGMHGFVLAFLCAFELFVTRAKVWDRRQQRGQVSDHEPVPGSLREMLSFMAQVASGTPARRRPAVPPVQLASPSSIPSQHDAILVQCASGDHIPLMELTRGRHEAYAQAHGMDYLCRLGPQQSERHACWDKIPVLLEILRLGKHRAIFWLDADTLIVDPQRDLREALPEGCWLGMVHHGDPPYFNNGVMYLRNTARCRALFEEVWRTTPPDPTYLDNETLVWVLQQDPGRWSGVSVVGDEWNSTALENDCRRPVVRAWHGYGRPRDRYTSMAICLQRILLREEQAKARPGPTPTTEPAAHGRKASLPVRPSANLVPLDPAVQVDFRESLGRPLRVRWEGDQFVRSSLALVNREFCLGLLAADDVELTLSETSNADQRLPETEDPRFEALAARLGANLSGPPDVTIRHHFPPNWQRPETGKLVVMQPWEWSHLPDRSWIEGAAHQADEVWAYSRFVRDVYVRSGVPAEKVRVVPLGVRVEVFKPEGERYALPTEKGVRFLFVGGALQRKGADLLLQAYLKAFKRSDDVCLVVKDMGTQSFYQGMTLAEEFKRAAADPNAPEIIYLDDDLSEEALASLDRACTCVVLPYRGEGFGLPPLEGMACGLPVIVTSGGSTDDYLDDTMALRVPHHRRVVRGLSSDPGAVEWSVWSLEPDMDALVDALRWVRDRPAQNQERGNAGRAHVLAGWTWERAVGIARERLLQHTAPVRREQHAAARPWTGQSIGDRRLSGSGRKGGSGRGADTPARPEQAVELSLCMIVRDEEARIGPCMQSIAPYVDEMVVVDTGSKDRTREIARDCGARVFDFPWTDSFAEARNQSLGQARGDWIFWMDADDVILPECGAKLRELIRQHPEKEVAYQVMVRIPPGPGEFSSAIVDHVKLFPNRPDLRFEHRIHEQILSAIRRAGLEIRFSDLYVTHEHYDRSKGGQAKKRQRDFRLLELDLRENPDHPFILFNLGMTHLFATREYEVAAHYLVRSLERSHPTDSIVRKAYALLTTARIWQREIDAAIAANEAGRQHYPEDAELLFQAGQLYQEVGRIEEARSALECLISGDEAPHYRSVDAGFRTYRGRHELALLHRRMSDERRSEQLLRETVEAYPGYLPARLDWIRSLHALGQLEEARRILRDTAPSPGIEVELRQLQTLLARPGPPTA